MARALLALGSNLGCPAENLRQATSKVAALPGTRLLARSRWYQTSPVGGPAGQEEFLNGCLLVETHLEPPELSQAIHDVEASLGRERRVRWDSRLIDIDLLLYDQTIVASAEMTLPHPRMSFRRFVLDPAAEIAGCLVHPCSGWTLAQLNRHLQRARPLVLVVGQAEDQARQLAGRLRNELSQPESNPGSFSEIPEIVSGTFGVVDFASIAPTLVIAWDCAMPTQIDNEKGLRDTIKWPGPLAHISGKDLGAVCDEAVAAIRAVWPHV